MIYRQQFLWRWPAVLVLLLGIGTCPRTRAVAQDRQSVSLEQGANLERSLQGGEAHEYQIALLSGQYLYLIVEQEGIDVAVTLFDPDGKKITTADSMNADYGPEPLVAVAEMPGAYRVAVAAGNKESPPGQYKISIVELRTSAPGDPEHIAAERNIERARELKATRNGADWDAAIARLQEALSYYETTGAQDSYRHGLVLFSIGYLQAQKSRVRESIAAYLAALPLFQSAGDTIMEARTRNNLGGEYHDLGEPLKAMQYHKEALAMLPPGKVPKLETAALNNLGVLYQEVGDWTAALDAYEKAASAFVASANWREHAIALRNLAYVYREMNEPEQALRYLEQALQLMQVKSINDPTVKAEILTSQAEASLSQGQLQEALNACEHALNLRRFAGDARREGDTLAVMASIYQSLEQPEQARPLFHAALKQQQEAGYQFGAFRSLLGLGNLDLAQKKISEARAELEQAAQIAASLGCGECKMQAESSLARLERESGNLPQSLQQARNAVEDLEKLHAGIGPAALQASFLGGHERAYELYIDLSLHHSGAAIAETNAAQAFQISERARARSFLEVLSGVRADLGGPDDPQLAKKEQLVRAELASNATQLLQLWQEGRGGRDLKKATGVENRIGQLEAEYNRIEAEKAQKNKRYAALTQPEYLGAREVQEKLLDENTLFLEYYLGDKKSYLWAISRDAVSIYELSSRSQIEPACRKLYELLRKRPLHSSVNDALLAAASELSNLVLGPVAGKLQTQRLVIAADGALQYVPFAALNQPGLAGRYEPLVLTHEIVNVPSASALAAQREFLAHRVPAERSLAIFADPVFSVQDQRLSSKAAPPAQNSLRAATRLLEHVQSGNSLQSIPRLPFTAVEAARIFSMVPDGTGMKAVGFDANRELATSPELARYRYLHFATHGYMDSRHPELSALVLSLVNKNGSAEDGFLRLQDIYNLRLHADLVVLSACETGLGREVRGEGLIGLTRGFMYAGAARVLVSLWDVSDQGTAELMPIFYKSLLEQKKSAAAALREAQLAMFRSRQWKAPYYWAPFTVQGEWK